MAEWIAHSFHMRGVRGSLDMPRIFTRKWYQVQVMVHPLWLQNPWVNSTEVRNREYQLLHKLVTLSPQNIKKLEVNISHLLEEQFKRRILLTQEVAIHYTTLNSHLWLWWNSIRTNWISFFRRCFFSLWTEQHGLRDYCRFSRTLLYSVVCPLSVSVRHDLQCCLLLSALFILNKEKTVTAPIT